MRLIGLFLLGLLFLLLGCDGSGYRRKGGGWTHNDIAFSPRDPASFTAIDSRFARDAQRGYYRGSEVADSDGASFEVLSDHEARDRYAVYYCDTYRKGQEYWTVQHLRVGRIRGADPASYTVLRSAYARDSDHVYFEGQPFSVRDVASFEPMDDGFARDAQVVYYERSEIRGSHGPSFAVLDPLDSRYVRDRAHVYYGGGDTRNPNPGPHPVVRTLRVADPAAVHVRGRGYALDTRQVWYQGQPLAGADAASFAVSDDVTGTTDAHDRAGAWSRGERVATPPAAPASTAAL